MAVSCHLGFYWTANSAIRSADPENPSLEPNMGWIGCTVCEKFALKYAVTLKLGFGVTEGHQKWHHSIEHIWLYSSFIVTYRFPDIAAYCSKIATPLYLAPRWGWSCQIYATTPVMKSRMMGLSGGERISMICSRFDTKHTCDRWTDRRNWHGIYAL